MKEFIKNIEIEAVNSISQQMEYRKIHAENMSNGKIVYIVGGRVRFTVNGHSEESELIWNYAKINMAFQHDDVKFIVNYHNPDWDGAEEFIMRKMHDGFDVYVYPGEYAGCSGEILVYNKKPWTENGHGFKFEPGERSQREIVKFLHRRMYSFR